MIKERDYSTTTSLATWYDVLLTVIWPANGATKVTVIAVIVQVIVIKAQAPLCVCVCVYAGLCVSINALVSLRVH